MNAKKKTPHTAPGQSPVPSGGLPGGKAFVKTQAPRWTKSEPNPRRAAAIHLLNGPATFHNRF